MGILGAPRAERHFDPVEFAVVILIAFGDAIVGSVRTLLSGAPIEPFIHYDLLDAHHLGDVVGYELAVLPMVALVLRRGGWRLDDFRFDARRADLRSGLLLWLAGVALLGLLSLLTHALFGQDSAALRDIPHPQRDDTPSLALFAAAFLVNPFFEEFLVTAYVIEALRVRFPIGAAIHGSVVIRMLYHLYQGPYAIIWYGAYGLLAAHAYARMGRLWPLVIAHALHDCAALALLHLAPG